MCLSQKTTVPGHRAFRSTAPCPGTHSGHRRLSQAQDPKLRAQPPAVHQLPPPELCECGWELGAVPKPHGHYGLCLCPATRLLGCTSLPHYQPFPSEGLSKSSQGEMLGETERRSVFLVASSLGQLTNLSLGPAILILWWLRGQGQ